MTRWDRVQGDCALGCPPCADCCDCDADIARSRGRLRRIAWVLTAATTGWNAIEAVVGIASGLIAQSVALVGYGLDSLVEVSSALIVAWRLTHHSSDDDEERAERTAVRLIAVALTGIAVYVAVESARDLISGTAPERSLPGIIVVALSLVVMPALAGAKRRVAAGLGSPTLSADAAQTQVCFYLSVAVLAGLMGNALFGLWWLDPIAGLVVGALALKEAREAWTSGDVCCVDDVGAGPIGATAHCTPSCCPSCPLAA